MEPMVTRGPEAARRISNMSLKIGLITLAVCIVLSVGLIALLALAWGPLMDAFTPQPQDFTYEEMTITLDDNFWQMPEGSFDVSFISMDTDVFCLRESFAENSGLQALSIQQYGQLLAKTNDNLANTGLKSQNGLHYFEYTVFNEEMEEDYHYVICLYKSSQAFWAIQFATPDYLAEDMRQDVFTWAKSVRFAD